MEQVAIFEYCGIEDDPLFQKLLALDPGEELYIHEVIIRRNTENLFEIETEDLHEPAAGAEKCYRKLMSMLNAIT